MFVVRDTCGSEREPPRAHAEIESLRTQSGRRVRAKADVVEMEVERLDGTIKRSVLKRSHGVGLAQRANVVPRLSADESVARATTPTTQRTRDGQEGESGAERAVLRSQRQAGSGRENGVDQRRRHCIRICGARERKNVLDERMIMLRLLKVFASANFRSVFHKNARTSQESGERFLFVACSRLVERPLCTHGPEFVFDELQHAAHYRERERCVRK